MKYVERLKLELVFIDHINNEILDEDRIVSNQILLGNIIIMRGQKFATDLIMFNIPNFDVILALTSRVDIRLKLTTKRRKFGLVSIMVKSLPSQRVVF